MMMDSITERLVFINANTIFWQDLLYWPWKVEQYKIICKNVWNGKIWLSNQATQVWADIHSKFSLTMSPFSLIITSPKPEWTILNESLFNFYPINLYTSVNYWIRIKLINNLPYNHSQICAKRDNLPKIATYINNTLREVILQAIYVRDSVTKQQFKILLFGICPAFIQLIKLYVNKYLNQSSFYPILENLIVFNQTNLRDALNIELSMFLLGF